MFTRLEGPEKEKAFLDQFDIGDELSTPDQVERFKDMLKYLHRGFANEVNTKEQAGLPVAMRLRLQPGTEPVARPPLRVNYQQREIIRQHVDDMKRMGIVEDSQSAWASAVVLSMKPNGKWRFNFDARGINKHTIVDHYPLPRTEDVLERLKGAKYFSLGDFTSGFWQVPVRKEDRDKFAFITPDGLYQWTRMPFGYVNSPAVWQRVVNLLCAGFTW